MNDFTSVMTEKLRVITETHELNFVFWIYWDFLFFLTLDVNVKC